MIENTQDQRGSSIAANVDGSGSPRDASALHRRASSIGPSGGTLHDIRADEAGWSYVNFGVHRLAASAALRRAPDDHEVVVLILEGSATIRVGSTSYSSVGSRVDVFGGTPPPVLLVEPGLEIEVQAESAATVIVTHAPGAAVRATRLYEPADIHIETRGRGVTERRIHHLLPPAAQAGRLILFEVFTPGGNWSSYPPHKHDTEDPPTEAYLEELYYFRFARPQGWAFQRVYTPDRSLDVSLAPSEGDVVLVPRGYHPVGMPAGYDGYYLNVMAGHQRAWHFTVDPDHSWLMDWDPALPR